MRLTRPLAAQQDASLASQYEAPCDKTVTATATDMAWLAFATPMRRALWVRSVQDGLRQLGLAASWAANRRTAATIRPRPCTGCVDIWSLLQWCVVERRPARELLSNHASAVLGPYLDGLACCWDGRMDVERLLIGPNGFTACRHGFDIFARILPTSGLM